ncbi:hypothetical protein D3C81_2307440 [compost metagenome]
MRITARFTAEKATRAPKLIIEARVARSMTTASSDTRETMTMATVGVLKRSDRVPNRRRGRMPSRPML